MGRNTAAETQRIALAGLILIVGFIGFSLTESILERSRSIIFFSFYLAALMALHQASRKKKCSDIALSDDEGNEIKRENVLSASTEGLSVETRKKGAREIILEKDVAAVFKDSESVNNVLRMLMHLAEKSVKK